MANLNLNLCMTCKGCRMKTIWEIDEDNNTIFVKAPYCHYGLDFAKNLNHCPNTPRDASHHMHARIRFSSSGR